MEASIGATWLRSTTIFSAKAAICRGCARGAPPASTMGETSGRGDWQETGRPEAQEAQMPQARISVAMTGVPTSRPASGPAAVMRPAAS